MDPHKISEAARVFASKQLASIEAEAVAIEEGGGRFPWAEQCAAFEGDLDGRCDRLGEKIGAPARDLFLAEARIEFYGALATPKQRHMWTLNRLEALSEIEAEEQVAA